MHLREGEYERAHTDFFEAFKNYDESGSPRFVKLFGFTLTKNWEPVILSKLPL